MSTKFADKIFRMILIFVFVVGTMAIPGGSTKALGNDQSISVLPEEDVIYAFNWPLGVLLMLEIDDPGTSQTPDYATSHVVLGPNNYEKIEFGGTFDIQPGYLVTVSDGNTARQHTVTHLAVTNVDMDADTISGIANPGSNIFVSTNCDANGCANRNLIADENGNWLANFASVSDPSQGDGVYDVRLASGGTVHEHDEDWDSTRIPWIMWPPTIGVDVDIDRVQGWDWPLGATVSFEIDDPLTPENPDYTNSATVHAADWDPNRMWFEFYTNNYDVKPGDVVTATDGNITKQLIVTHFRITGADLDLDIVYGIADPSQEVKIWTYNHDGKSITREAIADSNGNWSANFGIPGNDDSEQETLDIRNGSGFDSFVGDEDWDCTRSMWDVPNPPFGVSVNDNQVVGWQWTLGSILTIEIDDPLTETDPDYSDTATVGPIDWDPNQTRFVLNTNDYDLKTGDIVEVTDGTITKQLLVTDFKITDVDLDNDIVHGMADPNQDVKVSTCWQNDPCVNRDETADQDGNWTTNFAVPGEQDWEQETADLRAASWIDSSVNDEDGDSIMFGWYVFDQSPYSPFVVLGQEGVWLKKNTDVMSGDVAANIASSGPYLTDKSEVTIGQDVQFMDSFSRVMGDTVYLKQGSQVYDVYANELKGRSQILGANHTPLELPLVPQLPVAPDVNPGTQNFNLKKNSTLTLDAGSYGKLETKKSAVITFTGGVYHFSEWSLGDDAKIYFAAPTEIRIAGKLDIGSDAFIGPATGANLTARDILIYVMGENGKNGKINASPKAAMFGTGTSLIANVYTPNGTLWIRERSNATGAFFGLWVEIGQNVTLTLENGWH